MSEGQLPAYVDTRRAFLQDAEASGSVALSRLPRLLEILVNDAAVIEAQLRFTLSKEGERQITGSITMTGEVPCQRCLEPVTVELAEQLSLVLVDSESAAATLKPDWDPWVSEEYKLQLADIVEEQLLLALPSVNFHEDRQCIENLGYEQAELPVGEGAGGAGAGDNPFAVLKALKDDNG